MNVLAGDIGGTKTLLQLATPDPQGFDVVLEASYDSRSFDSLESLVRVFLDQVKDRRALPQTACFAVAGPVSRRRARVTNLPWDFNEPQLSQELGIGQVILINDFQGAAYGIEMLADKDFEVLQRGRDTGGKGVRALIGAGTGLGEGILIWRGEHYEALASEGGHVDFAPRDEIELELLRYLMERSDHVSYETVLSGRGLVRIYEFLRDRGQGQASVELPQQLEQDDPAAVIAERALAGTDAMAVEALDCFIRIYGAQAGNLALTCLATGGIFVTGGIAPKIIGALKSGAFIEAFRNKPPMSSLLADIPVRVVLNTRVGLLGARQVARRAVIG